MVESSFIFDFVTAPRFHRNLNLKFKISDMTGTGTNKFQLVFARACPDNIDECINVSDNKLNSDVTIYKTSDCDLLFDDTDDEFIQLASTVTFNLSDEVIPLKAIFLRDNTTGFVFGYCIQINPFTVTNELIFDEGLLFFTINNGGA